MRARTTSRFLLPLLLVGAVLATPAFAQGDEDESEYYHDDEPAVEEAEGPVSEADIVALCEFTAWMFERVAEEVAPEFVVPDDAPSRALDFWAGTVGYLDTESILVIAEMEEIWPAVQTNWAGADMDESVLILENVHNLIRYVWGDQVTPMASYLYGEISYEQFSPSLDAVLLYWESDYAMAEEEDVDTGDGGSPSFTETFPDAVSTIMGSQIVYD